MASWRKKELDAARHRQKREATKLRKLLSTGMRVETCLGTSAVRLCLKNNMNSSKPSEHPHRGRGCVENFSWEHWLFVQSKTLYMIFYWGAPIPVAVLIKMLK